MSMITIFRSVSSEIQLPQILAMIMGYFFAVVIAFSLHEFSHASMAYKLGDSTPKAMGRLTLNPIRHLDPIGLIGLLFFGFGWARPVAVNPLNFRHYRRYMFLVSISGVVTNIILAFLFSGCYFFYVNNVASFDSAGNILFSNSFLFFVYYFFLYSILFNIALFIFNLIPIYPLDGFNAINCIFNLNAKFKDFMYRYGGIIMLIFVISPLFDIIYGEITYGLTGIFFKFWRLFS